MGNYDELKQAVSNVIKTNGNQEITGQLLQNTLLSIISTIGVNATFAGIATPETNPGTPDANIFYIAMQSGIYVNFGGIEVQEGINIIENRNGEWNLIKISASVNFLNLNILNGVDVFQTFADARNSIPQNLRREGLIITYKSANGYWVKEQYIGGIISINASWQRLDVNPIFSFDGSIEKSSITIDKLYVLSQGGVLTESLYISNTYNFNQVGALVYNVQTKEVRQELGNNVQWVNRNGDITLLWHDAILGFIAGALFDSYIARVAKNNTELINSLYYIYDGSEFVDNSNVYIKRFGYVKSNGKIWFEKDFDQNFNITGYNNLVYNEITQELRICASYEIKAQQGDILLLVRSSEFNDFIGGALYSQYLNYKLSKKVSISKLYEYNFNNSVGLADINQVEIEDNNLSGIIVNNGAAINEQPIYELDVLRKPLLVQGAYDTNFVFKNSYDYYVTTSPIRRPFTISVNEEYRIKWVILVNMLGEVVETTDNLTQTDSATYNFPAWQQRTFWGIENIDSNHAVRITFCRKDGYSKLKPDESIIKTFEYIDDLIPITDAKKIIVNANARSNQVQKIQYVPVDEIPIITNYYDESYKKVKSGVSLNGLPYSSVKELDKFVPYNVSYKTFMTALNNKRSLLYSEIVSKRYSTSKYGFSYNGVGCTSYYGIACNWQVANILGLNIPGNSFEIIAMSGMELIYDSSSEEEFDFQKIEPLDILYRPGHICIVSNVYTNKYGLKEIIAWSEANISYCRISLYNEQMFLDRLHNGDYDHPEQNVYKIYRYSYPDNGEWNNSYKYSEYSRGFDNEWKNVIKYNNDICTFAGDEAKFVEGEKIVININKGSYTKVVIYKNNSQVNEITLDDEEEIDLDVSQYCNTEGHYQIKLYDGVESYSEPTTFDVYKINISLDSSKKVTFEVGANLMPFYIELQGIAGTFIARYILSELDITNGYKILTAEMAANKYVKLFCKTEDGYVITKRMVYNV